jgi:hypothetical protein
LGELLIAFFAGRSKREAVVGDLAEDFQAKLVTRGLRTARAWYWSQVARSFFSFAWRWVRRVTELDAILQRIGF